MSISQPKPRTSVRDGCRLLGSRHQFGDRLLERKRTRPSRKSIEEGLGVGAEVRCGREHAGTSGNPPMRRAVGSWTVPSDQSAVVGIDTGVVVVRGRRDSRYEIAVPPAVRAVGR